MFILAQSSGGVSSHFEKQHLFHTVVNLSIIFKEQYFSGLSLRVLNSPLQIHNRSSLPGIDVTKMEYEHAVVSKISSWPAHLFTYEGWLTLRHTLIIIIHRGVHHLSTITRITTLFYEGISGIVMQKDINYKKHAKRTEKYNTEISKSLTMLLLQTTQYLLRASYSRQVSKLVLPYLSSLKPLT